MTWKQIGRALGITGEAARLIALRAFKKIRRADPDLGDLFFKLMDVLDAPSPASLMVDAAPDARADGENWGGWRWNGWEKR